MTETYEQVLAEVNRIMRDAFNNQSIQLKYDTTAQDVAEWDSLNHIELVVSIERQFKIRFAFADLQRFKNVGEMCDNIVKKLARTGN